MFLASIFGFYAALIAYLLGEGESLSFIFTNTAKYSLVAGIIFWIFLSLVTFRGIKTFKKVEPIGVIAVFLVVIVLGIVSFNKIDIGNLGYTNLSQLFVPFGVVLFAFLGVSSVPEMRRVLMKNEKLMKKAIIIGSLIPLAVYILFTIVVLGLYGQGVTEIATISFGKIVTLLGIFTMFTAFLALNLALQDTYRFDFDISAKKAWLLATVIPLIAFIFIKLYNLAGFVKILSLGGAISGGIMAIVILLVHEKLKLKKTIRKLERKPEFKINVPLFLKIIFILLFIAGIVAEFV
jgi:tyrosine-specific transport protein